MLALITTICVTVQTWTVCLMIMVDWLTIVAWVPIRLVWVNTLSTVSTSSMYVEQVTETEFFCLFSLLCFPAALALFLESDVLTMAS